MIFFLSEPTFFVFALKPPKADVPPLGNWRSCLIVAVTLHFEMVVSAGKVADLQRVGMISSLGEFSTLWSGVTFPLVALDKITTHL